MWTTLPSVLFVSKSIEWKQGTSVCHWKPLEGTISETLSSSVENPAGGTEAFGVAWEGSGFASYLRQLCQKSKNVEGLSFRVTSLIG